ncbi:uncharacterized protein LOC122387555 isoform X1 [Amphibalanus amphitrite]|uniref:uncharacterized protein LOC122387555 isoform X1 n=2 Tax=Amphibalanus amphitrite TaxID=1232801 RepID=UPI001C90B0EB|nr:uncharacterized protein LOC122387555 isoform X1 [Amphibalanus amphitrite]
MQYAVFKLKITVVDVMGGAAMNSQQQYCLKWNNHQTNLQRVFARLLRNEIFTDVTLACEGHALQAHKLVLSACSSYFEHLFTMHPDKAPLVILKDIKYEDIKAIVEFMYQGEINISQEQLPSLIRTAETLKVKGLAEVSTGSEGQAPPVPQGPPVQPPQPAPPPQQPPQPHPQFAQHPAGAAVPQSIPLSMVAPTIADSSELQKQVRQRAIVPQPMMAMIGSPLAMPKTWGGQMLETRPAPDFNPVISCVAGNAGLDDGNSNGGASSGGSSGRGEHKEVPEGFENIPKLEEFMLTSPIKDSFWKQDTTKYVLMSIRDRKIDLKTGAELLGVSYNTIYGRYREAHGLLSDSPMARAQAQGAAAAAAQSTPPAGAPAAGEQQLVGTPATPVKGRAGGDARLSEKASEFGNIVQMNEYVNSGGSRPSFWELDATKAVMEAIRDKSIEMKFGAELLGVSYGTLYGRYRENYGYLKANWKQSRRIGAGSLWEEPQTMELLRRVNGGEVSINEAAEKLGVDYYVLQYQLNLMDMHGAVNSSSVASTGLEDGPPSGLLTKRPSLDAPAAEPSDKRARVENGSGDSTPAEAEPAAAEQPAAAPAGTEPPPPAGQDAAAAPANGSSEAGAE